MHMEFFLEMGLFGIRITCHDFHILFTDDFPECTSIPDHVPVDNPYPDHFTRGIQNPDHVPVGI